MDNLQKGLKGKTLKNYAEIKEPVNSFIQPFKEMPSLNDTGKDHANRINAHDLFSFYTADIIKEDIIFVR